VMNDLRTYYTRYYVLRVRDNKQMHLTSSSWSRHNWGAASWSRYSQGTVVEADEVGEQQLRGSHRDAFWSDHVRLVHNRQHWLLCLKACRHSARASRGWTKATSHTYS